ncbi:response regulator transcription factor [Streptomyces chartreusis]|uniref:response regulator transcription factor n=1 Tax=Streptomyces chartreusis TaxID=1969 RepID=UPI0035D82154
MLVASRSLVRRGIAALVSSEQGLKVVAEASSLAEALQGAQAIRPAAFVLDLPEHELSATSQLREVLPASSLLALVEPNSSLPYFVSRVERAGVAILSKDTEPHEFCDAIRRVAAGAFVIDPALRHAGPHILTFRERTILLQVADGRRNREIAERLSLSIRTVENHMNNILAKLAVDNRMQAVIAAQRKGLL